MMKSHEQRYVFGPVASRRLGRSLGVDLVPFKTCTYDCIYCQLGHTTCRTVERREWAPVKAVLEEVKRRLRSRPDYITLTGSGEPTLHSRLGEIIQGIRAVTTIPIAVLTNGSHFWRKDVRDAVSCADVVMPSLDAPDPERFGVINRLHREITFDRLVEGLTLMRGAFSGRYWLEIMLLDGYTTLAPQVRELADRARQIGPDKVQLNTPVRPPAEEYAMVVQPDRLEELAGMFGSNVEIASERSHPRAKDSHSQGANRIIPLLQRRPCTVRDIALGLGLKPAEVIKALGNLERNRRRVCKERRGGEWFYRATSFRPKSTIATRSLPASQDES